MSVDNWKMQQCGRGSCDRAFGRATQLREHRMRDHGETRRPGHDEIIVAVACPKWQELRVMLKGLPTKRKLELLEQYLRYGTASDCCAKNTRFVQVLNYLNALARGGQIAPLADLERVELELYDNVHATVKR